MKDDSDSETPSEEAESQRFEQLKTAIKQVRSSKKTMDYGMMSTGFENVQNAYVKAHPLVRREYDGKPPRFFVHFLIQLKRFVDKQWNDSKHKKSLSETSKKSLEKLKKDVDRYTKDFKKDIRKYKMDSDAKNIDVIEQCMGSLGPWQIKMCALIFLCKFSVSMHQLAAVYLYPHISFECEDLSMDKCDPKCPKHIFDTSVFKTTIQTEWDLVCDNRYLVELSQVSLMCGVLCGNLIFGVLSDKFGRRPSLCIAVVIQAISATSAGLVPSYWSFILMRFLTSTATGGVMCTSIVLLMELVGASKRTLVGTLYQVPFALGHMLLTPIAYFTRKWRTYQLIISIPSFLLISYFFFLPESPRWLLTIGETEAAIKGIERIARGNKLPTTNIRNEIMKLAIGTDGVPKKKAKGEFWNLFTHKELFCRTLCVGVNWFVCGFCFFGFARYMLTLQGNVFLTALESSGVEIPGFFTALWWMHLYGRKICLILGNLIAGISFLTIMFIPASNYGLISIMGSIGSFGIWISFVCVYIFAAELYPTVVRTMGIGVGSAMARCGSMIVPYIAGRLTFDVPWMPPFLFATVPMMGAGLCLFLPETLNTILLDRIEEVTSEEKKGTQSHRRA